jgi:zinc D-Ala-D-Ala carboxypeptidase
MIWDSKRWPNFSEAEMRCKHSGRCEMNADFMDMLQALRVAYGRPLAVTSGYRDRSHPVEAGKSKPGAHAAGRAVDIACQGADAHRIAALAFGLGFTGVGVSQHSRGARFLHLDTMTAAEGYPRPTLYSY